MTKWNTKCRFFNENYACDTLTTESYKSCEECKFSSNYDKKVLIIKLGALGDIIRTTPILEAIKERYPESLIYWLTGDIYNEGQEILKNNPYIDKVLVLNTENILRLQQEKFDIIYSLEISTPGTLITNIVNAQEKYGYYFNNGSTSCYNKEAEEYLETAFLTHIKLKNRKTYQELIFQACQLKYKKQEISLALRETHKKLADKFREENNIKENDKLLGINFGSGKRWPTKAWDREKLKKFIEKINNYKIILLGGPDEAEEMKKLKEEIKTNIIIKNTKDSINEFTAILSLCDKVITTDSLALHLSTALKKPVIALFFSTPPWEIEDYNRIKKITSPLLEKYFFSNYYSKELANSISVEEVLNALK